MNTEKPVVDYLEIPLALRPVVGQCVVVQPLNHPGYDGRVSNTRPARTSTVVQVIDDTLFETRNTIYRKVGVYSPEAMAEYARNQDEENLVAV